MRKYILLISLLICSLVHGQFITNPYAFGIPAIDNVFPDGNAASYPTEADSTSGWNAVSCSMSSSETFSHHGSSAMKATMTSGGNGRLEYDVTVENATTYTVSFWYKVTGATTRLPGLISWTGVTSSPNEFFIEDGEWHNLELSVTTNATTMKMRFYVDRGTGSGTVDIYVDEIIIT